MKSREKLWEICMEIFRQLYKEASPSTDFDKLIETGEAKQDDFYDRYFLEDKRQYEIINDICKKHKLTKHDKEEIKTAVLLGCSPTINIENQKRALSKQ